MDVTAGVLFARLQAIEAKQGGQNDHTSSQCIIFHQLVFPSESDFIHWYVPKTKNVVGKGSLDLLILSQFGNLPQSNKSPLPTGYKCIIVKPPSDSRVTLNHSMLVLSITVILAHCKENKQS